MENIEDKQHTGEIIPFDEFFNESAAFRIATSADLLLGQLKKCSKAVRFTQSGRREENAAFLLKEPQVSGPSEDGEYRFILDSDTIASQAQAIHLIIIPLTPPTSMHPWVKVVAVCRHRLAFTAFKDLIARVAQLYPQELLAVEKPLEPSATQDGVLMERDTFELDGVDFSYFKTWLADYVERARGALIQGGGYSVRLMQAQEWADGMREIWRSTQSPQVRKELEADAKYALDRPILKFFISGVVWATAPYSAPVSPLPLNVICIKCVRASAERMTVYVSCMMIEPVADFTDGLSQAIRATWHAPTKQIGGHIGGPVSSSNSGSRFAQRDKQIWEWHCAGKGRKEIRGLLTDMDYGAIGLDRVKQIIREQRLKHNKDG